MYCTVTFLLLIHVLLLCGRMTDFPYTGGGRGSLTEQNRTEQALSQSGRSVFLLFSVLATVSVPRCHTIPTWHLHWAWESEFGVFDPNQHFVSAFTLILLWLTFFSYYIHYFICVLMNVCFDNIEFGWVVYKGWWFCWTAKPWRYWVLDGQ